jgi:hypothetical protein
VHKPKQASPGWELPKALGKAARSFHLKIAIFFFSIIQYCVLQTKSQWNLPWCPQAGLVT